MYRLENCECDDKSNEIHGGAARLTWIEGIYRNLTCWVLGVLPVYSGGVPIHWTLCTDWVSGVACGEFGVRCESRTVCASMGLARTYDGLTYDAFVHMVSPGQIVQCVFSQ